jgi:hypothetical protein
LLVDLQQPQPVRALIDRLRRDFGNLREITAADETTMCGSSLAEPVAQKFSETLRDVLETRPDLQPRCEWLQEALQRFLNDEDPKGFTDPADIDDEIPW